MWRRATVASHAPRLLSSGKESMLWIRMVNVSCVTSAASSRERPYLRATENTSGSYLSSRRSQAPTSPLRQPRIRLRSVSAAACMPFRTLLGTDALPAQDHVRKLSGDTCGPRDYLFALVSHLLFPVDLSPTSQEYSSAESKNVSVPVASARRTKSDAHAARSTLRSVPPTPPSPGGGRLTYGQVPCCKRVRLRPTSA